VEPTLDQTPRLVSLSIQEGFKVQGITERCTDPPHIQLQENPHELKYNCWSVIACYFQINCKFSRKVMFQKSTVTLSRPSNHWRTKGLYDI